MKKYKKSISIIVIILAIAVLSLYSIKWYLKPNYSGTNKSLLLQNTGTVYYDNYGIPHIYTDTELDAQKILGYTHAKDRLWQMEVMRRIAAGRLSEIFGEATIPVDKLFLGLGINNYTHKTLKEIDATNKAYASANAYLEGVNTFIKEGKKPVEFYLLGIEKETYTLKDVLNIYGYMAFSFAAAHHTDPLMSHIEKSLGANYLKDLEIHSKEKTTVIKNTVSKDSSLLKISKTVHDLLQLKPTPALIGSNSWVIGPEKTKNGKVILANDPHIEFSQPAVWYEAHVTSKDHEMYGYHLAGSPFPLLGHNRDYAWGITMFENDDIDFYQEKNHPTDSLSYLYKNKIIPYNIRKETIKVKGQDAQTIEIKESIHGPILNSFLENSYTDQPIAMSWVYTQNKNQMLPALYDMNHAKSLKEFEKGVAKIHAPGLNIMYGDAKDNIAWWATAKLYTLSNNANAKRILNGYDGLEEKLGYLPFEKNPKAINPEWHYVYSANNQPEAVDSISYPGYYLPEDRAKRIVTLLEAENQWDVSKTEKMLYDNTSATATEILKNLCASVATSSLTKLEKEAFDLVQQWNGQYQLKSKAATIYNKWIISYLKGVFEDELGEEAFNAFLKTQVLNRSIASLLEKENSIWWDNTNTSALETKKVIISNSFKRAINSLEKQLGSNTKDWEWQYVASISHQHPIGKEVSLLQPYLSVGPFPINSGKRVINNNGFSYTDSGIYEVTYGPSTRRIIDFSDIEDSQSVLPTGQSGNPFSAHYKDQTELYHEGKFRKMLINKEEIQRNAKNVLTFESK